MSRRLKQAAVVLIVFAAARLVRPERANPATDVSRTIRAHVETAGGLQRVLLALSCQDASEGKMPGPYNLLHPDTRLSAQDIETICAAARQAEARAADRR
jgi:hypothetical protein